MQTTGPRAHILGRGPFLPIGAPHLAPRRVTPRSLVPEDLEMFVVDDCVWAPHPGLWGAVLEFSGKAAPYRNIFRLENVTLAQHAEIDTVLVERLQYYPVARIDSGFRFHH